MDKIKRRKRSLREMLPTRRRLIQVYAALLYNAHLKGYIQGDIYTGRTKALCVPGLNCYSCPGAVGACPLGALQNALASSGNRAPYYVLGIIMLYGLLLGRTICGFLCPTGLLQDLLYKLPTLKIKKNRITGYLSWVKYVILAVFVVAIPIYYISQHMPVPGFCKYICPTGTLEGAIGLLSHPANEPRLRMLNILFTRKFIIMVLIFGGSIFIYRMFCRFLCPLGAVYGLFNRVNLIGVKVEDAKCTRCGLCVGGCKMDVKRVGDQECIHCGACIDACPAEAISLRAGSLPLWEHQRVEASKAALFKRSHRAVLTLAPVLLAAALLYFNLPHPAGEQQDTAPEVTDAQAGDAAGSDVGSVASDAPPSPEPPTGSEVGMQAPNFTAELYGGGEFSLADTRGQVTVLNFWATWCGPCVQELPCFQSLHENYPEVEILAIHSHLVTDDVNTFLARYTYTFLFAQDGGGIITDYGGSTMLPQTVILNRDGVIVYNRVGSVTYELLESVIAPLTEDQQ